VKFETTPAFDGDYRWLKREQAVAFTTVVREKFAPACDAHAKDPTTPWPASLHVKSVAVSSGHSGDDLVVCQPGRTCDLRTGHHRW
jgi:hypothetical protein